MTAHFQEKMIMIYRKKAENEKNNRLYSQNKFHVSKQRLSTYLGDRDGMHDESFLQTDVL